MSRTRIFAIVFASAMLAAATAMTQNPGGNPEARKIKDPVTPTEASIRAGAGTFKKYCAFCHGPEAKGDGPLAPKDSHPADLTGANWDHGDTDGEIFAVVQNGVGGTSVMKGFKGKMPDRDMWNVINYLRSLGPDKKKTS